MFAGENLCKWKIYAENFLLHKAQWSITFIGSLRNRLKRKKKDFDFVN
jgi:hypothetical protein